MSDRAGMFCGMTNKHIAMVVAGSFMLVLGLIFGGCWAVPHYSVWERGMAGRAELERANQNRQIAVTEALAKLEAAKALGAAEVERARGVAEANKIIGTSLANNEAYLRYLWIQNMGDSRKEVVYIPTEAGIPILEAGNREHEDEPQTNDE